MILLLIIQNLYHQRRLQRNIFLNSKCVVVFKNPKTKTQIVYLARQFYPENSSTFHKMYLDICKDPYNSLFLYLAQTVTIFLI